MRLEFRHMAQTFRAIKGRLKDSRRVAEQECLLIKMRTMRIGVASA